MAALKNLVRYLPINFVPLSRAVLKDLRDPDFDIDRSIQALRDHIWGADLSTVEKSAKLFGTQSWNDLPMAVLGARALPLPPDRLPGSSDELKALCRWLLSRGDNEYLVDTFVEGWAGTERSTDPLDAFVKEFWNVREDAPAFFAATVAGNHGTALRLIVDGPPPVIGDARAIGLLARMVLIWAAFDCQATTARARRSMTKPFGWFSKVGGSRLRASVPIALFRPVANVLRRVSGAYRFDEDMPDQQSEGKGKSKPAFRVRHASVVDIRSVAEPESERIERAGGEFALNAAMTDISARLSDPSNLFLQQVLQEKTDPSVGNQQISQIWYNGLTPVQIVGLVSVRLAQLEQRIDPLLFEAVLAARAGTTLPTLTVPDFNGEDLEPSWRKRSRLIVHALRTAVLKDPDLNSKSDLPKGELGFPTHDGKFIKPVLDFLRRAGSDGKATEADVGAESLATFRDLDIAVNQRFAR